MRCYTPPATLYVAVNRQIRLYKKAGWGRGEGERSETDVVRKEGCGGEEENRNKVERD